MEIEEIKKRKEELEKSICELMNKFEDETNVSITSVQIHSTRLVSGNDRIMAFQITCKL